MSASEDLLTNMEHLLTAGARDASDRRAFRQQAQQMYDEIAVLKRDDPLEAARLRVRTDAATTAYACVVTPDSDYHRKKEHVKRLTGHLLKYRGYIPPAMQDFYDSLLSGFESLRFTRRYLRDADDRDSQEFRRLVARLKGESRWCVALFRWDHIASPRLHVQASTLRGLRAGLKLHLAENDRFAFLRLNRQTGRYRVVSPRRALRIMGY